MFYRDCFWWVLPDVVTKDNDPVNPGPDVEELPSIGTYSFRGEANKIVSGVASMDGDYFTCILSPEEMEGGKND